jgi:MFS transporter, DHA3 family, multidrug efflux protein
MSTTKTRALDLSRGNDRAFVHLLVNTLLVSVINFTVWFAITFYVFLETRSVVATGMIAGLFLIATALTGIWFGGLVDHHRKKTMMQMSALVSLMLYAAALALYLLTPEERFRDPTSIVLWVFVVLLMLGVIAGNIRMIAMTTIVTMLIPDRRRDRANGLVGTASGISFLVTSVISGLLVGASGMLAVLVLALVVLPASVVHLSLVSVPERKAAPAPDGRNKVDVRGTLALIRSIPGGARVDHLFGVQQFPRRSVHRALGRLRPIADVRAGLGPAVGSAEQWLYHRRSAGRQDRALP